MAKTKPIGVRFEEDVLEYLKTNYKVESPQKALNFMSNYFKQGIGMLPNGSLKPETALLLKPYNSIPLPENYHIGESKFIDVKISDEETNPIPDVLKQQRIAELEKELKNPPKTAQIGVRNWVRIREQELQKLKNGL